MHRIKTVFDLAEDTGKKVNLCISQIYVWSYPTEPWLFQLPCMRSSFKESFKWHPALDNGDDCVLGPREWPPPVTSITVPTAEETGAISEGQEIRSGCQLSVDLRGSFPTGRCNEFSMWSQRFAEHVLINLVFGVLRFTKTKSSLEDSNNGW